MGLGLGLGCRWRATTAPRDRSESCSEPSAEEDMRPPRSRTHSSFSTQVECSCAVRCGSKPAAALVKLAPGSASAAW